MVWKVLYLMCDESDERGFMSDFYDPEFSHIAEYFVDISDVFTDEVDAEGLQTLLAAFFSISHLQSGEAFLIGHAGLIEQAISYSSHNSEWNINGKHEPSHLATRALHTLQTEFTVSGHDSSISMKYAFPLRVRGSALGVIELSDSSSSPIDATTLSTLQNLADLAASVIDRTHCINQTRSLVGQLQTALNSRVVLEQAKGVLAERMQVDFPLAFKFLRNQARREQLPLHQVAQRIITELPQQNQSMKVAN